MAILGDFTSITAAAANIFPTATIVETGEEVPTTSLDHFTISGKLKDSGAFANIVWRSGYASTPGRQQLVWEIDGTKGSIRITGAAPSSAFIHIREPELYLNGERVNIEGESQLGLAYDVTSAWNEYAKGEKGTYATIEDAVRLKTLLEAIKKSATEGVRVEV